MEITRVSIAAFAIFVVAWSGCSSKSGSGQLQPGNAVTQSSQEVPFGDPKYQELIEEISENNGDLNSVTESKSPFTKMGDAFKKGTAAVGSALTPKPRVIPATDPVSLSSKPTKINVDVYYHAARVAEHGGHIPQAMNHYSQALKADPNHLPTLISLARLNDRQDNYQEAEKLYRQAITAAPEDAMPYNDLGLCLARQSRHQEAVVELKRTVELDPVRSLYRNNLATVLVEVGRVNEAWSELTSTHPPAEAHYNLGYLLYRSGQKAEARRQFALAYQADGSLAEAKQMLVELDSELGSATARPVSVQHRVGDAPRSGSQSSLVSSRREIRRIPPTRSLSATAPSGRSSVQLKGPVSAVPQRRAHPIPVAPDPSVPPAPNSNVRFPVRPMSGYIIERDDPSVELPTPGQLRQ